MTPGEMLSNLDMEGGDAGSDFNDGDLMGWFGWRVTDGVLTVTYEPEDDGGPGPKSSASWRLVPVEETTRPAVSDYDFENILISAVRYAVGRGTEHLLGTARIVTSLGPSLSVRARSVIARDIVTELGYRDGQPGMDREVWESALAALDDPADRVLHRRDTTDSAPPAPAAPTRKETP